MIFRTVIGSILIDINLYIWYNYNFNIIVYYFKDTMYND